MADHSRGQMSYNELDAEHTRRMRRVTYFLGPLMHTPDMVSFRRSGGNYADKYIADMKRDDASEILRRCNTVYELVAQIGRMSTYHDGEDTEDAAETLNRLIREARSLTT